MKKRIITGSISILMIAAILAGCGSKTEEKEPVETTQAQLQQTEAAETTQATEAVQETVPLDCVVVSTPYGNLQYQDQWMEFMSVDQVNEGSNLVITFSAAVKDVKYPLFELTIGSCDGDPVAQITDANGVSRDVYVRMMEITTSSALTDAEQNRIFAMQEDINYVIDHLK